MMRQASSNQTCCCAEKIELKAKKEDEQKKAAELLTKQTDVCMNLILFRMTLNNEIIFLMKRLARVHEDIIDELHVVRMLQLLLQMQTELPT